MHERYDEVSIEDALSSLVNDGTVFKTGNFYALRDEPLLAEKRIAGHRAAMGQLAVAKRIARFLSRFPYVQTIAVSGSLSKYYADENTDIDFFIITSPNRLWIARTLMHLFKKLTFVVGKQHWFCMNYYIDELKMEIPEKNLFTAIEIATLLPLEGSACFAKFIAANSWVKEYFPCYQFSDIANDIRKGKIRNAVERIFNSGFFNSVEDRLMTLTDKRWKKKSGKPKKRNHSKTIGMAVDKHFSKPDPKNFQHAILQHYENRVKRLVTSLHSTGIDD